MHACMHNSYKVIDVAYRRIIQLITIMPRAPPTELAKNVAYGKFPSYIHVYETRNRMLITINPLIKSANALVIQTL